MSILVTLHEVARIASNYAPGEWYAAGCEVWHGNVFLGRMESDLLANYLCRLHNICIPAANRLLRLTTEVKDLRRALEVSE